MQVWLQKFRTGERGGAPAPSHSLTMPWDCPQGPSDPLVTTQAAFYTKPRFTQAAFSFVGAGRASEGSRGLGPLLLFSARLVWCCAYRAPCECLHAGPAPPLRHTTNYLQVPPHCLRGGQRPYRPYGFARQLDLHAELLRNIFNIMRLLGRALGQSSNCSLLGGYY
jgi:hypothetical protein